MKCYRVPCFTPRTCIIQIFMTFPCLWATGPYFQTKGSCTMKLCPTFQEKNLLISNSPKLKMLRYCKWYHEAFILYWPLFRNIRNFMYFVSLAITETYLMNFLVLSLEKTAWVGISGSLGFLLLLRMVSANNISLPLSTRESGMEASCAWCAGDVWRMWNNSLQHPLGLSQMWIWGLPWLLQAQEKPSTQW